MTTLLTKTTGKKETRRDLHQRTVCFARDVRSFIRRTPKDLSSMTDFRRLAKSSSQIGSFYLNADGAVNSDQFMSYILACRDESRQSDFYLQLMNVDMDDRGQLILSNLQNEAQELTKIFGAIAGKVKAKKATTAK